MNFEERMQRAKESFRKANPTYGEQRVDVEQTASAPVRRLDDGSMEILNESTGLWEPHIESIVQTIPPEV